MSIDCCKSYVGKQIIGLLPSGGSSKPPDCLYFGTNSAPNIGVNCGDSWDIDNTYFPIVPSQYEIGISLQQQYQLESGGFCSPNYFLSNTIVWTRAISVPTNWNVLYGCDFNIYPVTFDLITCDLTTTCYKANLFGVGLFLDYMTIQFGTSTYNVQMGGFTTSDPGFITILQGTFGGNAIISVNDDGVKTYIEINNAYTQISPISLTTQFPFATTNFNISPC